MSVMHRLRFWLRQVLYDLGAGLLLRPALITLALAGLAVGLVDLEVRRPTGRPEGRFAWMLLGEPSSAQAVLGTIAGSMMAVVSIVYSVLVMALSLASMQFSPRILGGFMRDRISQTTLGVFIGTFTYCLIGLRSVRSEPAFVPAVAVSGALVLALLALGWLIFFIHHIASGIQANSLVERIARETEQVIDEVCPHPAVATDAAAEVLPEAPADAVVVTAPRAGYIQLMSEDNLLALALARGVTIKVTRAMGDFVPRGGELALMWPAASADVGARAACAAAFDLGTARTMQQDLEFGLRQIVDIGLKAISPAVNDPSTAATCIDHLGHLLAHLATRESPAALRELPRPGGGAARVVMRRHSFQRALDLALNQLRQYGRTDMAVSIRMLRALEEIAGATSAPERLARVWHHGRLVVTACGKDFQPEDREELELRLASLARACGVEPPAPSG